MIVLMLRCVSRTVQRIGDSRLIISAARVVLGSVGKAVGRMV